VGRARAGVTVPGPLPEVEALWLDPARWPAWRDGLAVVSKRDAAWPALGARVDWESPPSGRGLVRERVILHAPGAGHAVEVEDERLEGRQAVGFAPAAGGLVRVTLELDYRLKDGRRIADVLYHRHVLAASLSRTLARFAAERRADVAVE
jgi:hypothetical protein